MNGGTAFELIKTYTGSYAEVVLHNFTGLDGDGVFPTAGLLMDSGGNLYGTTENGGGNGYCGTVGCGTVFELPYSAYTERTLYSFTKAWGDGAYPMGGVIEVAAGNVFSGIYGTTAGGGNNIPTQCGSSYGCGTVFKLPAPVLGPPTGTSCSGTYVLAGPVPTNMTVEPNTHCALLGGQISGNVEMNGGTLTLAGTLVTGDVEITGPSTFDFNNSTIIEGNLLVQGTWLSLVPDMVCGATVKGDFQFRDNATSVQIGSSPACPGNTVNGDLQVENSIGDAQIVDVTVNGNLQVENNIGVRQIIGNTVGGNLQVDNNLGSTQVSNNTVTNELQCQNNILISGGNNEAGQKQGQCSSF